MPPAICLIIALFYNKYHAKIFMNISDLIITDCIHMLCIRIYLPCFLHCRKLFFIIKFPCHKIHKLFYFHQNAMPFYQYYSFKINFLPIIVTGISLYIPAECFQHTL